MLGVFNNNQYIAWPVDRTMPERAIIVEMDVLEGKMDEFLALIKDHAARSVAEEEGCVRFEVITPCSRDGIPVENKVWLLEKYKDEAAVTAHESTDRMKQLGEKLSSIISNMRLVHGFY